MAEEGRAESLSTHAITKLLQRACAGDAGSREELYGLVYAHLERQAGAFLRGRPDHTLGPSGVVHEAYLKLVERDSVGFRDRGHFLAQAARAMRWVLADHARARGRQKRGGDAQRLPITEISIHAEPRPVDILDLHEAMERLAEFDEEAADIVELRFFGGLTMEEIAEVRGKKLRTVERDWQAARAWLRGALR